MKYALSLAALAAVASGHSIFGQIVVGGTQYPLGYAIRAPSYNGPIQDVTTPYIACNGGPNPTTASPYVLDVVAGSTVKAVWRHSAALVIDASHKGPVMAYMKKVDNAASDTGVGGGWFKIAEAGYNAATGKWAVDDLIAANGIQDITIPKCIPNGQYLLRAELIALHAAGSPGQAQFYMECAQINVTGGTGGTPAPVVSLPGAYAATDPGILINIYPVKPPYVIPGPRPYTCGGTQPTTTSAAPTTSVRTSSTSSATTTRASTTLSTTTRASTTASTTTRAATTTSASSGGSPLYGQCGGGTWAGPFTCAAGTCVAQSQYYSQCLP